MRIVNVHNRHANPGGSEVVFEAVTELLRAHGDEVVVVDRDNKDIAGLAGKLAAFGSMIYSPSAKREMAKLLADQQPDLVHVHNIYPQLSPSILDACREAGVPVVMHVHDYKLTCPTAQHLRDGNVCEKCIGGHEYWCAVHNCRGSRPMSAAYAVRNAAARISGKIHHGVDAYVCPSRFVADQTIRGGFPAERVHVVPNFADLPTDAPPRSGPGDYIAYVGRISPEKGLDVLLEAARITGLPVKIAGNPAPMPELVAAAPSNVEFVGIVTRARMPDFLAGARMLTVPSIWYEAFGLVAAEAMAYRVPVVASNLGGLPEVVEHNVSGLCVPPKDPIALANSLRELWDAPARCRAMGEAGRSKALREYSAEVYYQRLTDVYRHVLRDRRHSERFGSDLTPSPIPAKEASSPEPLRGEPSQTGSR